jgi:hypothetical protein
MSRISIGSLLQAEQLLGFTGSRGDLGYTGSQGLGYTGSQGDIGYTGSVGSPGDLGYTGSQGSVGYTGSSAAEEFVKTYFYQGTATTNTGTVKLLIHKNATLKTIRVYVSTTGTNDTILVVLKNSSALETITIPAGQSSVVLDNLSYSLVTGDFITVDITQASDAQDLYVSVIYQV